MHPPSLPKRQQLAPPVHDVGVGEILPRDSKRVRLSSMALLSFLVALVVLVMLVLVLLVLVLLV